MALAFTRMSDGDLSAFTNAVITGMMNNPSYAQPPVALADLEKLRDAFDTAAAAAMDGGTALTAAKNAARGVLLVALRKMAAYVQIVVQQNMTLLLSSGFWPISLRRARSKLDIPRIMAVENEGTTKLTVRLQRVNNARSYEVRAMNGAPTPAAAVLSTQARRVVVRDLSPGTTYSFQARAIGGSDGSSEWSDPVSHMAIQAKRLG